MKQNSDINKRNKTMDLVKTIIAALAGGLIVLGGIYIFDLDDGDKPSVRYIEKDTTPQTLYTMNSLGEMEMVDFTKTADKVYESVVHIISYGTPTSARAPQQLPDPFREFFERYFDYEPEEQPRRRREEQEQRPLGSGSGVIINAEGYVVTNFHVIRNAERLSVNLYDNRSYDAEVVGTDPTTDLALLKIDGNDLDPITMVSSDNVEVGQWVLAVGNPFGLTSTVTAGIISATARQLNILREQYSVESFLQTDAAINRGNSGGALVNLQGNLIGINTAIASPTGAYSGYGFAVPSNIVNKVVSDLLKYGEVKRAILGVTIRNVNNELAEQENLEITTGVYVDSITSGSAADKGGMQEGDVIISVDGTDVQNSGKLQAEILQHTPGEEVNITVMRNGRERTLNITLGSLEAVTERQLSEMESELLRDLGVKLKTLSEEQLRELGIDGGVVVEQLFPGKVIRETRMREGFIITGMDKQEVNSVEDFVSILSESEGGVLIQGFYPGERRIRYYGLSLSS